MSTRHRKYLILAFAAVVLGMIAVACGAEAPTGDCLSPQDGKLVASDCTVPGQTVTLPTATPTQGTSTLPEGAKLMKTYGCSSCHAIDGILNGKVGPDLTHAGQLGADYIHTSIVDPNADIAPNCPTGPCQANIMPQNFGTVIPADELDTIVNYLASLN